MSKNKRGIESSTLVAIIIIIIGFAILLIWFSFFKPTDIIDKETCRQSVTLRNIPLIGTPQHLAPLKCKTQQITIEKNQYKTDDSIRQKIANEMYDCWWQFGEGNMNPFTATSLQLASLAGGKMACGICSIITFDDKLKKEGQQGKTFDIVDYMQNNNVPTKDITYLEYFTQEKEWKTDVRVSPVNPQLDYAVIFFDFRPDDFGTVLAKDAAVGGAIIFGTSQLPGGSKLLGGIGKLVTSTVYGKIAAGAALVGTIVVQAWVNGGEAGLAFAKCRGDIKGCQQVILVPYDAAAVSSWCKNIQTIP